MITFSASKNAVCEVTGPEISFLVFPKAAVKDQWVLLSHPEENLQPKTVSWPGEYDIGGMIMRGVGQKDGQQVSYSCEQEGMRFAFIDAPILDWSDSEVEGLGNIDILVVAAGDAKKLSTLVEAIDPRVIMLFPVAGGDTAAAAKACGASNVETVSELKLKHSALPQDNRQVVILGE